MQMQLEALLVADSLRSLYFEQVRVYRNQFGAAELSPTWRVTWVLPAINYLDTSFVAFASVERDGNQLLNNQVFDNAKLTRLSVRVNNRQYPDKEIETNFAEASRSSKVLGGVLSRKLSRNIQIRIREAKWQ